MCQVVQHSCFTVPVKITLKLIFMLFLCPSRFYIFCDRIATAAPLTEFHNFVVL
uniref:Uncharacterized protein n=1 Tax=Papilio xuthus TaxID=66420 RepID=I4DLQ8_PAPXU|nr:unknown unsecreted protein [Papilio xuthus]